MLDPEKAGSDYDRHVERETEEYHAEPTVPCCESCRHEMSVGYNVDGTLLCSKRCVITEAAVHTHKLSHYLEALQIYEGGCETALDIICASLMRARG